MFKSNLNEISRGRNKLEEQKSALENIKLLYESQELKILLQLYLRLNTKHFTGK